MLSELSVAIEAKTRRMLQKEMTRAPTNLRIISVSICLLPSICSKDNKVKLRKESR